MGEVSCGLYDDVASWLEAMGEDPTSVAVTLRTEEVRGVRGSVFAHPVCRWLTRLVPDLYAVLGSETIQVFRPGRGAGLQGVLVPLPPPVRAFADRFDDGQHPELELWVGAPAVPPPRDPAWDTVPVPTVPTRPSSFAGE